MSLFLLLFLLLLLIRYYINIITLRNVKPQHLYFPEKKLKNISNTFLLCKRNFHKHI